MDWIKRQLKRAWGALVALIVGIAVLVFRLSDEVAPTLDDMARAVPPPTQIADGLQALDGAFITNSRIIQYVPAGNRTLDATLETLSYASDIPWLELVDIYEDIEAHVLFQQTVDELLPIVRAQMSLAMLPADAPQPNWINAGLDSFLAPMGSQRGYLWFLGNPTEPEPVSNLFVFGLDQSGLASLMPPDTTLRSLTRRGSERLPANRQRVFQFYPLDGQIGYLEHHAVMNGHAYCYVTADAGIVQQRGRPASTENLLMLNVASRIARDLDETCIQLMPDMMGPAVRFRHSLPDGRAMPGLNASETIQLGPLSGAGNPGLGEWEIFLQELADPGSTGAEP